MPLRCLGSDGQTIQSFDLTDGEWSALRLENRRSPQLRMPCCDASAVMKTSTRGLNFFAHKSRGPCQSAPPQNDQLMSEHHILRLKPALRLERRGQHGQNKPNQRNHRSSLADSVTRKIRIGFSVHTATKPRALQAYLGHRNIQHMVRYTELEAPDAGIIGSNRWDGLSASR
jgi:hypothetical protein